MLDKGLRKIHRNACLLSESESEEAANENSDITYSIVPRTQSDSIAMFLVRYYHQLEPMTVALGMPKKEIGGWFRRFIRMAMHASVHDVSVQATDEKEKRRVGVLSSIIIDPNKGLPPSMFSCLSVDPEKHPINMIMKEFYDKLETGLEAANFGSKDKNGEPVKTLEHMFMSTSPEYGSKGISTNMVALSESVAATVINCQVGYVIATSEYSYRVFKKRGYEVMREIKYADYTDSKGVKIFADKVDKLHPHTSCRAMVKKFKNHYE